MPVVHELSMGDVLRLCAGLDQRRQAIGMPSPQQIWGIPRGGQVVAGLLRGLYPERYALAEGPKDATLFVDDIVDSGATRLRYQGNHPGVGFLGLIEKPTPAYPGWVSFPWERAEQGDTDAQDNVRRLLQVVGEDVTRPGLADTPRRVLGWLRELTAGYDQDPVKVLARTFKEGYDELVVVRAIPFVSLCEHHLLPFTGHATVGYLPRDGVVVGLSKIPRCVRALAQRLQVQERLTQQIAQAIETALNPFAVGVVLEGHHQCMRLRGIRAEGAMVTSCLRGAFRTDAAARAEFLGLARTRT